MRRLPVELVLSGVVLVALLALRIADPEPIARLRLSAFDSFLRLAPRTVDPATSVMVVDIDETSLGRLGQWPWPRSRQAELVDRVREAGAKTVALDLILAEPDRFSPEELAQQFRGRPELAPLVDAARRLPSNDELLAVAISRLPSVLGISGEVRGGTDPPAPRAAFATSGDDPRAFVPHFPGAAQPIGVLSERASALGAVNWLPSGDQIVRHVPLIVTIGDTLYPSLSLEHLRLARKETTLFVRASGGSGVLSFGEKAGVDSVRAGGLELPAGPDGQLWLRFAPYDHARYVPAHALLDGSMKSGVLAGRHVIIGSSATGLLDLRAKPLDAAVPGVEIHAQALEQMLSGDHLVRPSWATGAEIAFLTLSGALVAWLIGRLGPIAAAVTGSVAALAVLTCSWLAFGQGLLVDPVYAVLSLVALYLSGSLLTYIRTETERARVRAAFGHYVSAPLVEELASDPAKLKLGGEMREVTVLFADVRGFSGLSEGMEAEELIRFVNALFTPLSEIILESRGTIDKFMGDTVMAFWNAPLSDPAHAANACRAALRMMSCLDELNRHWPADVRPRGAHGAKPVRIGIGLNTGLCCVGNVGSPERFDYSILGDSVNIASRLEEATKTYGVVIIAGEGTMRAAAGLAWLEIDRLALRGKTRLERIFALLGDESLAGRESFEGLRHDHAALVSALATGDKAAAGARLSACRAARISEANALLDRYAERLARMVDAR